MEDIRLYIESGILELYVLGDLSREETLEVETIALKHPEIRTEILAIEQAMEFYAQQNSIEPSTGLHDKILSNILTNDQEVSVDQPAIITPDNQPIVSILPERKNNFYKYAFAACLALLLISIAALISTYNQLKQSKEQLIAVQLQTQSFASRVNLLDKQLDVYHNPDFKLVKLAGTPQSPSSAMLIAWNPTKKEVLIDKKAIQLSANDADHQYQLWALVDGKPINLGVFDTRTANDAGMLVMKSIGVADAFAVTLEPRGGSVSPTMDQMVLMGKPSSI